MGPCRRAEPESLNRPIIVHVSGYVRGCDDHEFDCAQTFERKNKI